MANHTNLWLFSVLLITSNGALAVGSKAFVPPLGYGLFKQVTNQQKVPTKVLYSVCLQESGRTRANGDFAPWPWTLNIKGRSYYYDTYNEVYEALMMHINSSTKFKEKYLVDVGLCQVNLYWHRDKLDLSEQGIKSILIPENNVNYAASYLRKLWKQTNSLSKAVGYYHSRNAQRATAYQHHVKNKMEQVF